MIEEEADAAVAFASDADKYSNPEEMDFEQDLMIYWRAWHALRFDRNYTFGGEAPIPFSSVDRYASRHGINGIEFDFLFRLVTSLDIEYLNVQSEKRKQEEEQRKANKDNLVVRETVR